MAGFGFFQNNGPPRVGDVTGVTNSGGSAATLNLGANISNNGTVTSTISVQPNETYFFKYNGTVEVVISHYGGSAGGFPITLGSTSIGASSTTTSVAGLTVNGVTLTNAGTSGFFLTEAGGYNTVTGALAFAANSNITTTLDVAQVDCNGSITLILPSSPLPGQQITITEVATGATCT